MARAPGHASWSLGDAVAFYNVCGSVRSGLPRRRTPSTANTRLPIVFAAIRGRSALRVGIGRGDLPDIVAIARNISSAESAHAYLFVWSLNYSISSRRRKSAWSLREPWTMRSISTPSSNGR